MSGFSPSSSHASAGASLPLGWTQNGNPADVDANGGSLTADGGVSVTNGDVSLSGSGDLTLPASRGFFHTGNVMTKGGLIDTRGSGAPGAINIGTASITCGDVGCQTLTFPTSIVSIAAPAAFVDPATATAGQIATALINGGYMAPS